MNLESAYLTKQIIAYIGNKRKLLSLIYKALELCRIHEGDNIKFADLFCGSGVVSRFAKSLGFEVHCNDWEYYATLLAEGFIKANKRDLRALFGGTGQYEKLINEINSLPAPAKKDQYIARYYAAHKDDISKADNKTERLFYTHQNALAIDKIRNYIEQNFPEKNLARSILISNLLYESATHTNTSGVFKAYHKEFGGHGKDALTRILGQIELHPNELIDSDRDVFVYNMDANKLVKELPPMDVVYLDPPYNQHQYGSNYHMLNTIARWDKIPEPLELNEKGVLKNKAGIRTDWVKTRSPYCYRDTAIVVFEELIKNINSKYILISYSSDGIIPFDEMKRICLSKGYVSIVTSDYVKYRGGKQSNKRLNSDIEFILVIDTCRKSRKECEVNIDKVVLEKKVLLMLKRRYCCQRVKENFKINGAYGLKLTLGSKTVEFESTDNFTLNLLTELESLSFEDLSALLTVLEKCVCSTKQEELEQLIELSQRPGANNKKYIRAIPATLKKFAQKKYRDLFYTMLSEVRLLDKKTPDLYALIKEKVDEVEQIATIRFNT